MPTRSIAQINTLSDAEFQAHFAGVLEHSPQYAAQVAGGRPYPGAEALAAAFARAARGGTPDEQRALIRAHPDLAGKAARAGDLTRESAHEQASAGLDRLSDAEYAEFHALNAASTPATPSVPASPESATFSSPWTTTMRAPRSMDFPSSSINNEANPGPLATPSSKATFSFASFSSKGCSRTETHASANSVLPVTFFTSSR